ncbi:thioredoxin fold domain-containing protein [Litoribacter ruber]|uniref:thioredoxin domain-containing protein n=1 Tax=Litoribacter ruber TaxID=702568 RepID=UPI001BD93E88|nr:thioredoxin domain-containing protein [Litoribacter ruber]MBT0811234.1 thioredoxin fold domain-containing protein [Litoribacter ruber]
MKKILFVLALSTILSACGEGQLKVQDQNVSDFQVQDVNATKFKEVIEQGEGIILDVRTSEEVYSKGYIQDASLLDYYDEDFREKISLMSKDKDIYLYCASGGRSIEVVKMMEELGFKRVYHLNNGLMDWENAGFTLVKDALAKDDKIEELSLDEFEAMLVADKPILIDFHTVWCAPCRKMAPIIDKVEEDLKDMAIIRRIDLDKSKEVGKAYSIQGVPVFVIFKDGKEVWRHNGIISEEELKVQLNNI